MLPNLQLCQNLNDGAALLCKLRYTLVAKQIHALGGEPRLV